MFDDGKGRESFSESCLLKNADVSVRKRLPTLCSQQSNDNMGQSNYCIISRNALASGSLKTVS